MNSLKAELERMADEVLQCSDKTLIGLLSSFDILSDTYYEKRLGKIETHYDVYGTDILQTVKEKWLLFSCYVLFC